MDGNITTTSPMIIVGEKQIIQEHEVRKEMLLKKFASQMASNIILVGLV